VSGFTCPRCGRVSQHPDELVQGYCGACHAFTGEADRDRLRFRLYVERRVVDERWVNLAREFVERASELGDAQNLLARQASEAGLVWHVEVFDPSRPPGMAYLRFGTDKGAMRVPIEIQREEA
jgi:hypothetical protein